MPTRERYQRLLSIKQVAAIFGIDPHTLRNQVYSKGYPCHREEGRILFSRADVQHIKRIRVAYSKHGGNTLTCVCGSCSTCKARERKARSRNAGREARPGSEIARYRYFRRIVLDLYGPDANLQSSLDPQRWTAQPGFMGELGKVVPLTRRYS